jgi:transcriptional regulator with XRE-family HTH domain
MPAMRSVDASPEKRYVHPVAAYRQRHDLTLEELGERCKPPILKFSLSRIETGMRKPTFAQLNALVEACRGEVTAEEIIRATPKEVAA